MSLNNSVLMGGGNSPRQSNFELLRIVAMFLVLVIHASYLALGRPSDAEIISNPISSFVRYAVIAFSVICVNLFILISGYFRIRSSRRSVLSFIYMVVFWHLGTSIAYYVYQYFSGVAVDFSVSVVLRKAIPGADSWFIESYVLLLILAPMINAWLDKNDVRTIGKYVLFYICFEIVFSWWMKIYYEFRMGYSVLSFIGLYITGAYLRMISDHFRKSAGYYLGLFFIATMLFALGYNCMAHHNGVILFRHILGAIQTYDSPMTIISSVLLFVAFSRLSFQNRFVNSVAKSAFAVYLFHMHFLISPIYLRICEDMFKDMTTVSYILSISLFLITLFVAVVLVDRLRIFSWSLITHLIPKL